MHILQRVQNTSASAISWWGIDNVVTTTPWTSCCEMCYFLPITSLPLLVSFCFSNTNLHGRCNCFCRICTICLLARGHSHKMSVTHVGGIQLLLQPVTLGDLSGFSWLFFSWKIKYYVDLLARFGWNNMFYHYDAQPLNTIVSKNRCR